MQLKKKQLEPDMELTGSKLGKEYIKAVYPLMSTCYMTIAQGSKLRQSLVQYSELNNRLSENFTSFSLMSFFCSGIPSHLNLLQPGQPLSLSCLPSPWPSWKVLVRYFTEWPLIGIMLVWCFLMGVRKIATQNIISGDQVTRVPCYWN